VYNIVILFLLLLAIIVNTIILGRRPTSLEVHTLCPGYDVVMILTCVNSST